MANPEDGGSFWSEILKPGSSLQPKFLLMLDGAFTALLLVLVTLAFITSGSVHIFVLIGIELALWASVKWFVYELKNMDEDKLQDSQPSASSKKDN